MEKVDISGKVENILGRIVQIRKQRGYSLDNMAVELEISESAYRKIEFNQTKLSLEKFLQIAKILKVTTLELLDEKSNREYHQQNSATGTFIGHQEFENYYQENKDLSQKLISSYESKIKHLEEEVLFLRRIVSNEV
ncbi:MAG: helix-turn-helix transcriptional regulator [Marinilabiliaceae bacterium]|nr:helix-turn-helix transcriptional regulator [Marinilabiliaceae bacterium]